MAHREKLPDTEITHVEESSGETDTDSDDGAASPLRNPALRTSYQAQSSPRGIGRTDSNQSLGSRTNSTICGKHGGGVVRTRRLPTPTEEHHETEQEYQEEMAKIQQGKPCASLDRLKLTQLPDVLPSLQYLTSISLGDNSLCHIQDEAFVLLTNLTALDLSGNKLTTVPASALFAPQLHTLLLDHNELTELPELWDPAFPCEAPNLTKLGLEWNRIGRFPAHVFRQAPALEQLMLSENPAITTLGDDLSVFAAHRRKVQIRLANVPSLVAAAPALPPNVTIDWVKIYPDKVLEWIYLGSMRTAQCVEIYRDLNIGYVLTAGRDLEVLLADKMTWLELPIDDLPNEDITPFFDRANDFIDEAKDKGVGVLVHCFAGLSRSVTIVVAYLMKKFYPLSRDDALAFVRRSRPAARPNDGFLRRLLAYEEHLKGVMGDYRNPLPAQYLQ